MPSSGPGAERAAAPEPAGLDRGQQLGRLGQATDAVLAVRGELALAGRDHGHAAGAQQLEVGLRRRDAGTCGCSSPAPPAPGRRAASAAAVSRLSAWPWASLAIVLALAGRDQVERRRAATEREVGDRAARRRRLAGIGAAQRVGLELADQHRRAR